MEGPVSCFDMWEYLFVASNAGVDLELLCIQMLTAYTPRSFLSYEQILTFPKWCCMNLASQIIQDGLIKLPIFWPRQKIGRWGEGSWACGITEGPWEGERKEEERSRSPWVSVTRRMWPKAASEDWTDGAEAARVEHGQGLMGLLDEKQTT